jgi:hypothetical protein
MYYPLFCNAGQVNSRSVSVHNHAAIDTPGLAGYIGSAVAEQKLNHFGHIFGLADAL